MSDELFAHALKLPLEKRAEPSSTSMTAA